MCAAETRPAEQVKGWIAENLLEQAPISVAVVDPSLRIVLTNGNFSAIFGDAEGRSCFEVYKKRTSGCADCAVLKTLRDGKSRISEQQGVDRLGNRAALIVHHSPVYDETGTIACVVNMSYDVTEQKKSLDHYNLIFEHAPCALSVINKDFRIVRANAHVRDRFGEPIGSYCYQIYKRRDSGCAECPAMATFADGQPHSSRQVRRASDGSYTYHVVSTAPLGGGDPSHVVEMSLDVTDTHVLAERLLESERLAAVGQTVTQLAHSIKNILTGLQGGIYDIRTGQQRGDLSRSESGLETLERNYRRITELVKNFLRFSKEHRLEVGPCDPVALAEEIYQLYRQISEKNGIDFQLSVRAVVGEASLDARGIHTCLANLVANAFDACKQSPAPSCRIELSVDEQDDAIVFEVTDSGCGMDDVVLGRIFRGIFTTKGPSGTGLGLVMTKKIVEDHGGTIGVRSQVGGGSSFRIALPRQRLPRPDEEGPDQPAPREGGGVSDEGTDPCDR